MGIRQWENMKIYKTRRRDDKLFQSAAENRCYCMCGHSKTITPNKERALCEWCNLWVYRDAEKQEAYEKKVKEEMRRYKANKFINEMRDRLNDKVEGMASKSR